MPQTFIDWELVESRECGPYRYDIMHVETAEHVKLYRGRVFFAKGGDYWLEGDSKDALRMSLITLGQQRA
jgi:hypothetical protein